MQLNVRVYGLLITDNNELLVSDELIRGAKITKLPGGGLEVGEGTIDCIKREFVEECNLKVEVLSHFYTTDFFQPSAFNAKHQIISIYYKVKSLEKMTMKINTVPFDFDEKAMEQYNRTQETETFRLISLSKLNESDFTLPIDKVVAKMLIEEIRHA